MEDCYGQHGWREFHRNRKTILEEFDKLREQTINRPVHVAHGTGVEAKLREWLSEFLPKKYGVTSGYIIPNLYGEYTTLYHYDIIIFNKLDAPILWTEGNVDQSEQGKARAIPAKYVLGVYEVKSRFNKKNIVEALKKLNQINSLSNELHENYSSGIFFIEFKIEDVNKSSILESFLDNTNPFKFAGGIILRYEGDDSSTGRIELLINDKQKEEQTVEYLNRPLAKPIQDLKVFQNEEGNLEICEPCGIIPIQTSENTWAFSLLYTYELRSELFSVFLSWSRTNFSLYFVEMLARLEGMSFKDLKREKIYFGRIFDRLKLKEGQEQKLHITADEPFIRALIISQKENDDTLTITDKQAVFKIIILLQNIGNSPATLIPTNFYERTELQPQQGIEFIINVTFQIEDYINVKEGDILEEIYFRIVYYTEDGISAKKYFFIKSKLTIWPKKIDIQPC